MGAKLDIVVQDLKALDRKVDQDLKDLGRKVDSKFNRLMYMIVGGVVMKASFDLYIKERNWNRAQKEK